MNVLESIAATVEADVAKAVALEQEIAPEVTAALSGLKAAIANPSFASLFGFIATLTTHTPTPGSAVVVEPKPVTKAAVAAANK